jgi:hypothetical protein
MKNDAIQTLMNRFSASQEDFMMRLKIDATQNVMNRFNSDSIQILVNRFI